VALGWLINMGFAASGASAPVGGSLIPLYRWASLFLLALWLSRGAS
jgi:hypothetical protein